MNKFVKVIISLFLLNCLICSNANAWYGDWHFGNRYYNNYASFFGFTFGGWFPGPNIVINVPVQREYYPICETVEVCDDITDECWLEKYCR
ncbi:hypothetical protein ACNVED_05945 [Legionella sp. D16C41]|uniref:hypothetical protein n=1 Tax=Legionella sp. D16C41 TaxID=3402688 RepID=UPI003AF73DD8